MLISITARLNHYKLGEPLLICHSSWKIRVWNNSLKTCFCNSDTTLPYSKSVSSSLLLLTENKDSYLSLNPNDHEMFKLF